MAATHSVLAALAATACLAVAQSRRPLLGRVVDGDGNRLANTEVHCAYFPPGAERNCPVDYHTATTDERGRFRFQVHPCTPYLLWAISPAGDDGRRLASEVEVATSGAPFELRAIARVPAVHLTVVGVSKWADRRPLTLRLAPEAIEVPGLRVPLAEDGTCTLPPLPSGRTAVDILDRDGNPLYSGMVSNDRKNRKLTLQPPREIPMRVVDPSGKPIAGARIRQRLNAGWLRPRGHIVGLPARIIWRDLGRTDGDGRLTARIAYRKDPFATTSWQRLFFVADKAGHTVSHSGFTNHPFLDGKEVVREGLKELRFTLHPAQPFSGRLLVGDDKGLANQPVVVRSEIRIDDLTQNGWTNENLIWHTSTDADGRFTVPGLHDAVDGHRVFLGGDQIRERFVPPAQHRMTSYQAVALHRIDHRKGDNWQLDLRSLVPVQLRFRDLHGAPASNTEVLMVSKEDDSHYGCDAWTANTRTDSAGRTAMLLQPGNWLLFARAGDGMVYRALELDEPATIDLEMKPLPSVRGKVVDGQGKPIANARLNCHSSTWHSVPNRDPALEAIAGSLNWSWIDETRTDANGNFVCSWLSLPGMTYEVTFRSGNKKSNSFQLEPSDEPVTITIE